MSEYVKHKGVSDGYHDFGELYSHRAALTAFIVAAHPSIAWKSKLHHDGTMIDDHSFIVGINLPAGTITYHYNIDPWWDVMFCKELERAPEWDGATPDDTVERLVESAKRYEFARHHFSPMFEREGGE